MKLTTLATSTALALFLTLGGPASAQEGGAHATHSKQMKNDAGVKEGEPMSNAAPKTASETKRPSKDDADTHCTHSKEMKNAGVKEGECMENAKAAPAAAASKTQDVGDTHTLHTKQMKQDRGVKDGEPMADSP